MDAARSAHPTHEVLSSYGLGKLDEPLTAAVNKHLEKCADCRKQVAEISADSFLGRVRNAQARDKSTDGKRNSTGRKSWKKPAPPLRSGPVRSHRAWPTTPTTKSSASSAGAVWAWCIWPTTS